MFGIGTKKDLVKHNSTHAKISSVIILREDVFAAATYIWKSRLFTLFSCPFPLSVDHCLWSEYGRERLGMEERQREGIPKEEDEGEECETD